MKKILIHIATWIVAFWATAFMCVSCGEFTMRGDTFTVIDENSPISLGLGIHEFDMRNYNINSFYKR